MGSARAWPCIAQSTVAKYIAKGPARITPDVEDIPAQSCSHHLVRDRDAVYGHAVTRQLVAMGIGNHPIAARSP